MSINKAALDQASAARKQYRADTPTSLYSVEGEDAVFIAAYLEAAKCAHQPDAVNVGGYHFPISDIEKPYYATTEQPVGGAGGAFFGVPIKYATEKTEQPDEFTFSRDEMMSEFEAEYADTLVNLKWQSDDMASRHGSVYEDRETEDMFDGFEDGFRRGYNKAMLTRPKREIKSAAPRKQKVFGKRVCGLTIYCSDAVPQGEVWFCQDDKGPIHKIIDIGGKS